MSDQTRILLVDAEVLVRQAISRLVNSLDDYAVIGEATTVEAALSFVEKEIPDIILLEVALEGPSGIELLLEFNRRAVKVKTVILSSLSSPDFVAHALLAGADSYVLKSGTFEELVEGLRTASTSNRKYLPRAISDALSMPQNYYSLDERARGELDPLRSLTIREREIFHLLANGLANADVANILLISPRTVETHRRSIVTKLKLDTNAQIIRYAVKNGLTVP